jgi:MerR family transcriptional regulator, thiopeptide resistance regulator
MIDSLDIAEVARRTGLSSRALRFYEARGLVKPLRTSSRRRHYGPAELARLHQILVLKAAGLSLAQMDRLFSGVPLDLGQMLRTQIKLLDDERAQIDRAQSVIQFALSRIDRGEPVDAATLCSLIESGDKMMKQQPKEWREVTDRYFSVEEKAEWADYYAKLGPDYDFDAEGARWRDLGGRIKAALPLKPDSIEAQAFVDEWFTLLKPFAEIASPQMWNRTVAMYDDMDNWTHNAENKADPGFDKDVWNFIKLATADRMKRGGALIPSVR